VSSTFLSGVIEGFYGQPWTDAERAGLFDRMAAWELNTYVYAPKDDLKHRALWREAYSPSETEPLVHIIEACRVRRLRFIYAISPGLDMRFSQASDLERLFQRIGQMVSLGCSDFAVLFDDIPGELDARDLERWGSLAAAHSHVANSLFDWLRDRVPPGERRFVFCPTPYCGRMAASGLGGPDYLATIGRLLRPRIDIFWTGPEIISREIPLAHVQELQATIRRPPLIWDNLHANDYDSRRCFCGPYSGRPPELRAHVTGVLSNPNNELALNYVPLHTLAAYARAGEAWDPRAAYLRALDEWLPAFATIGRPIAGDDLRLLADCFYLPHEDGAGAGDVCDRAEQLAARPPSEWGDDAPALAERVARLKDICERMTELRDRSLLHAFGRRLWDLRESLDALDRYVASGGTRKPGARRVGVAERLRRLIGS
jgi:protein O-GlcNAcase/histone acetyltransferase